MKKLFCILLSALMLASCMTGCNKAEETTPTTPAVTTEPAPTGPVAPMDEKYDSITIAGVALSEYTIVYAPDAFETAKEQYPNSFTYGETHYAKLIAEEMAQVFKNMVGVELRVVPDTEPETANEILVGETNRKESAKQSNRNLYLFNLAVKGTKLVLEGASSAANYDSMERLFAYFQSQGTKDVTVPAGFATNGDADVITVACIGDSITAGAGSSNGTYCTYPAILQRILWKDYLIINYGNSGKTMREDLADAYIKCPQYTSVKSKAKDVDIALIMLGTNDSNRDQNWNDNSTAEFEKGYRNLLEVLKKGNPDMKYVMMNCPVYGGTAQFGSETVRNLQRSLTSDLKSEGWDMYFFDMYTFSKDVITLRNFPDSLHPGDKGYAIMANGLANKLLLPLADGTYGK